MPAIDEFFEGLPEADKHSANIFEEPKAEVPPEGPITPEEGGDESGEDSASRKNRRERRLEQKIKAKDDMLNALNDRIIELSLSKLSAAETKSSSEVPAEWIALYGDTPEAKKAWDVNAVLLNRAKEEAKQEALQEFENQRVAGIEEEKKFEQLIDSELEALEDQFDVDLTSDAPVARKARREFLEMVQELSPKDDAGTIIGYADFGKTFEYYQSSRKTEKSQVVDKRKELASRSMTKGSSSESSKPQEGPMTWEAAKKAIRSLSS